MSAADSFAAEQRRRWIEMSAFTEEQNLRRFLGPPAFQKLLASLKTECEQLNRIVPDRFSVSQSPLSLSLRDTATGYVLRLEYEAEAAGIACECRGEADAITFHVNHDGPSVVMVFDGQPMRAPELAAILLSRLRKS